MPTIRERIIKIITEERGAEPEWIADRILSNVLLDLKEPAYSKEEAAKLPAERRLGIINGL